MTTAASKVDEDGSAEEYAHYMIRGSRGWQWRSYGYKQLPRHLLKAPKTWELGKAFFLGTAKGTKNNYPKYRTPTTYIKFQCKVKLQTNENKSGIKCGGSPPQTPEGRRRWYQQHLTSLSKEEEEACAINTIPLLVRDKHADSLLMPSPPTQNWMQPS